MWNKQFLCLVFVNTSSIADFMALSWSVMIVFWCLLPITSRNVSNTYLKVSIVSSCRKIHTKIHVYACPVMPTKGANGNLYLFVMYVVSKLTQSPESA